MKVTNTHAIERGKKSQIINIVYFALGGAILSYLSFFPLLLKCIGDKTNIKNYRCKYRTLIVQDKPFLNRNDSTIFSAKNHGRESFFPYMLRQREGQTQNLNYNHHLRLGKIRIIQVLRNLNFQLAFPIA